MSHTPRLPPSSATDAVVTDASVTHLASRRPRPGTTGCSALRDRDVAIAHPPPPRPPSAPPPPGPEAVAALVRAVQEVRAGVRSLEQVDPLLAPTLRRRLGAALRRGGARPAAASRVQRVLLAPPTPSGAVEGTVLLDDGGRVRALAVRLERHHGGWRATELTAPEDGHAPLRTASTAQAPHRPDAFDEVAAEDAARRRLRLVSG